MCVSRFGYDCELEHSCDCDSEYDEACQWFILTQQKALNAGHTISEHPVTLRACLLNAY